MNPIELDEAFTAFMNDLPKFVPDGIVEVNLELLNKIGILHIEEFEETEEEEQLPHYFHVIETSEKVTLFNHQFAIWIVPQLSENASETLVLIALIDGTHPLHLEIVFSTGGVYNTPKFVLKLLRHFLGDVIDNEEAISSISSG